MAARPAAAPIARRASAALPPGTRRHTQRNFDITTRKLPISKAGPIDAMSESLGIPVPEMIFGDNAVRVRHEPSGWTLDFNAHDALDAVDKTDRNMLQVAHAHSWTSSRERTDIGTGVRDVIRPFDWSYSTVYRGSVGSPQSQSQSQPTPPSRLSFQPTTEPIPIELLKRRDPILFFDDVMLYESELDDNGISMLSVKVRVHEHRMLLLCRLFMRLDNVLLRIRDTRIYIDFETEQVTREYTAKEAAFEDVKKGLLRIGLVPDKVIAALRDANKLADLLPVVDHSLEGLRLGHSPPT